VIRRVLFLSGVVLAGAVALVFLTGHGRHTLTPPTRTMPPVAPVGVPTYSYDAAKASHSSAYVWPVIDSFLTDVPEGARVLDLGSGTGELLASFTNRGWERVGLDISASGVNLARTAHPEVTFVLADATGDLGSVLELGSFDVVVSSETLEHVTLPRLFVANAYRALKPGGRLVISTPYNGYLKHLAIALLGRSDAYLDPFWDWGHIKFFSVKTMSTLLWDAGFVDLEYEGAGRIPYFWKSMVFVAHKPR